jgi:hypothetical protein
MQDTRNLVQVIQALPPESKAVAEYYTLRNKLHAAELSCSMTNEENQRLKVEQQTLREAVAETNTPVAYYRHGGVIYGVLGTASISYVNLLRQLILSFKDATQYVVPEIQKGAPAPKLEHTDTFNEVAIATEQDQFQPDPVIMQACEENRQDMNDLTREERDELETSALAAIAGGASKQIQELKDRLALVEHQRNDADKAEALARVQLAEARRLRDANLQFAHSMSQALQSCQQENAELLKRIEQADVVQKKLCEQVTGGPDAPTRGELTRQVTELRFELERANTTIKQLRLDRQAMRDAYATQAASTKA